MYCPGRVMVCCYEWKALTEQGQRCPAGQIAPWSGLEVTCILSTVLSGSLQVGPAGQRCNRTEGDFRILFTVTIKCRLCGVLKMCPVGQRYNMTGGDLLYPVYRDDV